MNRKKRVFRRRRFFILRNRRFYEKTSRFFDCLHLSDQAKVEFEFDLIKIWSSLIVNAKKIFTKNVVKRLRDAEKIEFKSDVYLIKILSSLVVNAKRILFNSKRTLIQIVSSKRSIEDKEKRFLFERKVFSLFQSAKIRIVKIKKQDLIKNELRMFESTMRFAQRSEFKLSTKNALMTFVQFLRSIDSAKVFIVYKRKNQKMKLNDICVSNYSKLDDDASWKKNIIKKKKYIKNLTK